MLKTAANYLTSDVISEMGLRPEEEVTLTHAHFAELMHLVTDNSINSRVAKDLLKEILFTDNSPKALATERGLMQSSDPTALLELVDTLIAENAPVVAEYYAGKEASLQFMVGQGMKKSRGTANPGLLLELLKKRLEETR